MRVARIAFVADRFACLTFTIARLRSTWSFFSCRSSPSYRERFECRSLPRKAQTAFIGDVRSQVRSTARSICSEPPRAPTPHAMICPPAFALSLFFTV